MSEIKTERLEFSPKDEPFSDLEVAKPPIKSFVNARLRRFDDELKGLDALLHSDEPAVTTKLTAAAGRAIRREMAQTEAARRDLQNGHPEPTPVIPAQPQSTEENTAARVVSVEHTARNNPAE